MQNDSVALAGAFCWGYRARLGCLSCALAHACCVLSLLRVGDGVFQMSSTGWHDLAVYRGGKGDTDIVSALIDAGAKTDLADKGGRTRCGPGALAS